MSAAAIPPDLADWEGKKSDDKKEMEEQRRSDASSGSKANSDQGGVKSAPSSPRLRVGVILTDPEPVNQAL